MLTRDFFRLFIKLFSLYILIRVVASDVPFIITNIMFGVESHDILFAIAILLIIAGLFLALINKYDKVIDFLKLDQGFSEDRINLGQLKEEKIVSIVIIIIGGLLLVDHFPTFLYNLFLSFKSTANTSGQFSDFGYFNEQVNYQDFTIAIVNCIIGYLFIINNSILSKWIVKKTNIEKS